MKRGETSVNLRVGKAVTGDNIHMGMQRFPFIALLIAHAPVNKGRKVKDSSLDTGVVKAMLNGIVDRIQSQNHGNLSDNIPGLAQIVYLIEVVGVAGLLCHTFPMGLAVDSDFHVIYLLPLIAKA